MSNQCNTSRDCDILFNDSAVRFCYESAGFTDEVFFCDCSPWFGWKGEKCDQESFQLYWFRTILCLTLITSSYAVFGLSKVIFRQILLSRGTKSNLHLFFYAALCFFLCSLCYLINSAGQLPSTFISDRFEIVTYQYPEFEDLTVKHGNIFAFFLLIGPSLQMFGILIITLTWFSILQKTSTYFPQVFGKRERVVSRLLKLTFVLYVSALAISVSLNAIWLAILALFLIVIVTIVLYSYATNRFVKKLKEYLLSVQFDDTFETVSQAYKVTLVCMIIGTSGALGFIIISAFQYEILTVGGFNFVLLLRDISGFSAIFLSAYMSKFLSRATKQLEKSRATSRNKNTSFRKLSSSPFNSSLTKGL